MRKNTTIILAKINEKRSIHFTSQPLAGVNNEANNVTSIIQIRQNTENYFDYKVVYNGAV